MPKLIPGEFYLNETDWGQITFLPEENEEIICDNSLDEQCLPDYNQFQSNWDDTSFRRNPPTPLNVKNISLADLEKIGGQNLQKYQSVKCCSKNFCDENKNFFAFAFGPGMNIYGLAEDNIIVDLFIDFNYEIWEPSPNQEKLLVKLGKKYNLIIVDWAHELIVHPDKEEEMTNYLNKIKEIYNK